MISIGAALCVSRTGYGQTSPPSGNAITTTGFSWELGVGYPDALSVGGSLSVRQSRLKSIPGRGSLFRGVEVGATAGVGAVGVRVSWVDYFAYDAGREGWSIDARYVRPWILNWGVARGVSYVGAGASWQFSYLRVSGALVTSPRHRPRRVVPVLHFGFVVPFTRGISRLNKDQIPERGARMAVSSAGLCQADTVDGRIRASDGIMIAVGPNLKSARRVLQGRTLSRLRQVTKG